MLEDEGSAEADPDDRALDSSALACAFCSRRLTSLRLVVKSPKLASPMGRGRAVRRIEDCRVSVDCLVGMGRGIVGGERRLDSGIIISSSVSVCTT